MDLASLTRLAKEVPVDEVFVDASFWVAIFFPRDQNHRSAQLLWEPILRRDRSATTTNWTLYEALTFLNRRGRHGLALDLLELARRTTDIDDASRREAEALSIFERHPDKSWSVVDCANFACIRERRSLWALSFDRDFVQAQAEFGFTLLGAGADT